MNLKKKAKEQTTPQDDTPKVTRSHLKEVCPPKFTKALAAATTLGSMVDLLKQVQDACFELNNKAKEIEALEGKLKAYFIQELPKSKGAGATGIAGKKFRVQLVDKVSYSISSSDEFYTYVKKNNAFDLLTRAISAPAVKARFEAGKQIPGLGEFKYKSVSLTKIKEK